MPRVAFMPVEVNPSGIRLTRRFMIQPSAQGMLWPLCC